MENISFITVLVLIVIGVFYAVGSLMHFLYWAKENRRLSGLLDSKKTDATGQPARRLPIYGCYLESLFYLGTTTAGMAAFALAVVHNRPGLAVLGLLPLIDGLVRILDPENHLPLRFLHLTGWAVPLALNLSWLTAIYAVAVMFWWIMRGPSVPCR